MILERIAPLKNYLVIAGFCLAVVQVSFAQSVPLKLSDVPFSYFGSYMTLSTRTEVDADSKPGLFIYDVSRNNWSWGGRFRIDPIIADSVIEYELQSTSTQVVLRQGTKRCEITFDGPNILRFRYSGMGIRLSSLKSLPPVNGYCFNITDKQWLLTNFCLSALKGEASTSHTNTEKLPIIDFLTDDSGVGEFAVEFFMGSWEPKPCFKPFETCRKESSDAFASWCKKFPSAGKLQQARDLALYVNWSAVVSPWDNMTRHGMLMSKNWMTNIWSWDNCFNALGTSLGDFDLAWQQIQLMFDHQAENGIFPDGLNDRASDWMFVKPPVYGFFLKKLLEHPKSKSLSLLPIYQSMVKHTEFWFRCRDTNKNGIPEYFHGNDSGWDNGTIFDSGFPAESADLCAFLIVQIDFLADLADRLGKSDESKRWTHRSDVITKYMIDKLWVDGHFVSMNISSGKDNKMSRSLLSFIPLIIGERLPPSMRKEMISNLRKSGFLTTHGPATEHPESSLYEPDGYWRGPIWAPSTYLIVEGLKECGDKEYAAEVALRFMRLCEKSGFPENFNAVTGEPLRDKAYTWTASVFLLLANEYTTK